jgi:hypothetical protein
MAFYGAIGTFINESGAEYLLTESGMLAEGSLMGFIRGNYYNRCTRIHDILALVMERKWYENFLSTLAPECKDALDDFFASVPQDRSMQIHYLETSPIFQEHMHEYDLYFTRAMNGDVGPTAQYWTMYVYMVNRVHRDLMRAVRTNDVDGYINILPALIDIFFNLIDQITHVGQLEMADPRIRAVLQAGAFSLRRTGKISSRSAIDLTLEQTVNRDAASPVGGIVGFHHSHNAIRRWCVTSAQSGMSVTELRKMTGLEAVEQPATQLRAYRIEKDSRQKDALYNTVTNSCDPFSLPVSMSVCLLNIATGRAASQDTKEDLTKSIVSGHDRHVKFRKECAKDEERICTGKSKEEACNRQGKIRC